MRLALSTAIATLVIAAAPAAALGATRYAAPSGSGSTCSQASPCGLGTALTGSGVAEGDTVLLAPGTYPTLTSDFDTTLGLHIAGRGAHPTDTLVTVLGQFTLRSHDATISNVALNVRGVYGFAFLGSLADRLLVYTFGAGLRACSIFHGTLRDSVCISNGGAAAVFTQSFTEEQSAVNVRLQNVTAYGTGGALGLAAGATTGTPATLHVTNSIIHSTSATDIKAFDEGQPGDTTTIALDHSNYKTIQAASPSSDLITAPGTAGNQTASPAFVNAAAFNLREAAGSPTINAGTASSLAAGELNADGGPRVVSSVPDIGAYEFTPASPGPGPGKTTKVVLKGQTVKLNRSGAPVKVGCGSGTAACTGTLSLTIRVTKVTTHTVRHRRVRKVSFVTITLGRANFKIQPGRSATITVGLSRSARHRIGRHGLRVRATLLTKGNSATRTIITLRN